MVGATATRASKTHAEVLSQSGPSEIADVLFVAVLGLLGVVGFRTVYGGWSWLIAGGTGLAAGILLGVLSRRRGLDVLGVAVATVGTYFALSGVAVADKALGGVVPTPGSARAAASGAVSGWAELLTTLPPVGRTGSLGAVPLLCGLSAGVLSTSAALRTRGLGRPLLPLVALMSVGILFGTAQPASLVLQGGIFGSVCIGWMAFRRRGTRASAAGTVGRGRLVGALLMLVLAASVAAVAGDRLPGAYAHERFVLRERTDPPFDPRSHPSPLASFRRYKDDRPGQLRDTTVFTVSGMPDGAPLRLAVMDAYDGVVWRVAGGPDDGPAVSGVFERVGEEIPSGATGEDVRVQITVGAYDDIWIPDLGAVTGIQFGGPRADQLASSLRFDRTTSVGAVPIRLNKGDRIVVDAKWTPTPPQSSAGHPYAGRAAGAAPVGNIDKIPPELTELAERIVSAGPDPAPTDPAAPSVATDVAGPGFDRALRLAQTFVEGPSYGYSDGLAGDGNSVAGHSTRRMQLFATDVLKKGLTFGNAEQYASALGLMSRSLGLSTRVVMGFCPTGCPGRDVAITGNMVTAWVEVDIDGAGWVPLVATPSPDKNLVAVTPEPKPKPKPENASQPPPPPVTAPPPQDVVADDIDNEPRKREREPILTDLQLTLVAGIGLPIVVVGVFMGGVVGMKRRRRHTRRHEGAAIDRAIGSWRELDDRALDLGRPLPRRATRREIAMYLGTEPARRSAVLADAAIFGPVPPTPAVVEELWSNSDAAYDSMAAEGGRLRRLRADLNPSSLIRASRLSLGPGRRRATTKDDRHARQGQPA